MTGAVVPFDFGGVAVRTVVHEGDPWFVARDVALVLGYANPLLAVRTHCKGVSETLIPSVGGDQTAKIIPERDVYRLIMRSKLPAAEAFEEWIVGTVLPSLRKHGGYISGQETMTNEQVLANAILVAHSVIAEKDAKIARLEPLAAIVEEHFETRAAPRLNKFMRTLDGVNTNSTKRDLERLGYLYRQGGHGLDVVVPRIRRHLACPHDSLSIRQLEQVGPRHVLTVPISKHHGLSTLGARDEPSDWKPVMRPRADNVAVWFRIGPKGPAVAMGGLDPIPVCHIHRHPLAPPVLPN